MAQRAKLTRQIVILNMKTSIQEKVTIINKLGLHARAAAKFASTAGKYGCKIHVGTSNDQLVDAKSVMSLMLLAASKGTVLYLNIQGSDAETAYESLKNLVANRFNEKD